MEVYDLEPHNLLCTNHFLQPHRVWSQTSGKAACIYPESVDSSFRDAKDRKTTYIARIVTVRSWGLNAL